MEGMLSEATPHSTTRTAAVVFAGFCAFVTLFAPQPLLPLLAREFRVSAAAATSFGQLLFWRFLQGIFTPGIFAVIIAYINEEWQEGAGAATAAYVTGTVLGGFSGRALAALVASHASWRWAFVM